METTFHHQEYLTCQTKRDFTISSTFTSQFLFTESTKVTFIFVDKQKLKCVVMTTRNHFLRVQSESNGVCSCLQNVTNLLDIMSLKMNIHLAYKSLLYLLRLSLFFCTRSKQNVVPVPAPQQ